MNRKNFIKAGALGLTGFLALKESAIAGESKTPLTKPFLKPRDEKDPIKTSIIKEFVIAGHKDLNKVKEMLADQPNLIFCRYDWGSGDFEEAIEGAGHLGNQEIANYLINQGARVNLFVLTMLGKTELVKPTLEAYPNLINAKGPHGFTLLHHAKVGGENAKELYEYLLNKGLKETQVSIR